jgi:outer membrane protein
MLQYILFNKDKGPLIMICYKKNKVKFLTTAVLTLLCVVCAWTAQAETIELTLEQAIGLGLKNSSSLKSKMLSLASAGADVQAARSSRYTAVSVSSTYSHISNPPEMGGLYLAAKDDVTLGLSAQQPIYTFGKIKTGIKLAEEGLNLARFELEEEKRSLIMSITRAFYGYILAREVLAVQEETLLNKREALGIARKRFESGLGAEIDVMSAESDVESFMPEVISARNDIDFAILAVKDLLEIGEQEKEYDIVLLGELKPDYRIFTKDELVELAMKNNFNLNQYRSGIHAAEHQNELAVRGRYPTISGFANYTVESGFDPLTGENKFSGSDSWSDILTVGVSVQVQLSALFPWSGENAQIKKTELDLESLQTSLNSVESGIRLTIQNILLRLEREKAKIRSGQKSVELARKYLETSKMSYENGLISSTDLKDAQLNLNQAQLGLLSAIYNYNMDLYDLFDAVGVVDI